MELNMLLDFWILKNAEYTKYNQLTLMMERLWNQLLLDFAIKKAFINYSKKSKKHILETFIIF